MAVIKPFEATEFTPTRFTTAQDKAAFANQLASFVASGFPRTKFTKSVYRTLSTYCFGHIAHYDLHGFWDEWFATPASQQAWVRHVSSARCYGDPSHTHSDVEAAFQRWLAAQ